MPAGTWPHAVEVVDGKIVITRKGDGSQAVLTYTKTTSPGDVGGASACLPACLFACMHAVPPPAAALLPKTSHFWRALFVEIAGGLGRAGRVGDA